MTDRHIAAVDTSMSTSAVLRPVGMDAVRVEGGFWGEWRERNRLITLPAVLEQCDVSGRLRNFERAAGRRGGDYEGKYYSDSDIYKWLEAAAWSLADDDDPGLRHEVDRVVELVCDAQQPDGYINTYFTVVPGTVRWSDLPKMHELYCAGHMIQAAVALHRSTGDSRLLDAAVRFADLIDDTFGPDRRRGACGHPGVEMALVELGRETGTGRYLDLARWFVDEHGRTPPVISGDAYHQDHKPFRLQTELTNHAVRVLYLCSGVADIVLETGEVELRDTLERLWANLHQTRVYITGGIGSRHELEAVGDEYELPNDRAYAETCAGVGHAFWAWRMLLGSGDTQYSDAFETALYNAILPGVSLHGDRFFYGNVLADDGTHRRSEWFTTACCPPNIARVLASLPGYIYSTGESEIWVHNFISSTARIDLGGEGEIELRQVTNYPNDGSISMRVGCAPGAEFGLRVRLPAWCSEPAVQINGSPIAGPLEPGSYARMRRHWNPGDEVQLVLPMPVRLMQSHPRLTSNTGQVAIMRGPLVYCIEQADNGVDDIRDVLLSDGATWAVIESDDMPGVLNLSSAAFKRDGSGDGQLYRPRGGAIRFHSTRATLIPYFAWANRSAGPMRVWIPTIESGSSAKDVEQ